MCAQDANRTANWKRLFDGTSLAGWKATHFGGEGEVTVENAQMLLEFGDPLTGVTYQNELPTTNYELRLEAMRVGGLDFFCGLTFPVGHSHCSFIVGGWSGSVVGLSNIDGRDASENESTRYMTFENGRWYRIRVRVTPDQIAAWIDDEQVVRQSLTGHTVSLRAEVLLSRPLGIAAYETRSALRNIELRELAEGN